MENPFELIITKISKIESQLDHLIKKEPERDEYLGVNQLAELLGITKQTIYQWTRNNSIPHRKHFRKLYFSKKEIEAWLESNKRITADEAMKVADSRVAK